MYPCGPHEVGNSPEMLSYPRLKVCKLARLPSAPQAWGSVPVIATNKFEMLAAFCTRIQARAVQTGQEGHQGVAQTTEHESGAAGMDLLSTDQIGGCS